MPGSTPKERMIQVAEAWRVRSGVHTKPTKHVVKKGRGLKTVKGSGFFTDFVKGVSSVLSFVPGPVGTVASIVNKGVRLLGGGLSGAQINTLARSMHGGKLFTTKEQAYEEGRRLAADLARQ